MAKSNKHIIALLFVILPFYLVAILQKLVLNRNQYMVQEFLGIYMLLSLAGIITILVTNKYYLNQKITLFIETKGKFIQDIALGFLLLCFAFFIYSVANITYERWIPSAYDNAEIRALLDDIFQNNLHGIIFIGPFIWLNEIFLVLSIAFLLNNLWKLNSNKYWSIAAIILVSLLISLLQIDRGLTRMITALLIYISTGLVYFNYRRIYPLLISAILIQTIDLVSYWIYN